MVSRIFSGVVLEVVKKSPRPNWSEFLECLFCLIYIDNNMFFYRLITLYINLFVECDISIYSDVSYKITILIVNCLFLHPLVNVLSNGKFYMKGKKNISRA